MAIIKGTYKVLNNKGTYDTVYIKTDASQVVESNNKQFVSLTEKAAWNNKAEKSGSASQDFSARNLNVSNAILPTKDGIDIGSAEKRFRGIYVDEAYLSTNTLYIGDTPILGTNDDTIMIKANPNQSITMQTRATGMTKVISEAGVQLSTSGMNANVVLQATGSNSQVNIASTGSTNINAANVNVTGASTFKSSVRAEKDLTVAGSLTVTGNNATLSTSNLVIKDNLVEINNGESGNGVSAGKAGIRINRGGADAFNVVFDETDDSLKVGPESALKTVALQDWVTANTAKSNHTHNYLPLSGGNLTGNLTINSNAVYHVGNKPTASEIGAAPRSHNHNSGNITALTGYTKPSSTSAIVATDTLNAALGKLEKGLESKKDSSWTPSWADISGKPATFNPATHTHASNEIQKMTGYVKGSTTSAIAATDSLNAAMSKIEVALDGKMEIHSHPYRSNTWVPSWSDVTSKPSFATVATSGSYNDLSNKPTIITINDSSTTATTQTWSAKKINDSLAGKAASSHTHAASQITGLGSAATLNAGTSANQVLKLDSSGKVPVSTLPSIAINETFTAQDQAAALKLTVEVGDIVIVTSDSKTYICIDKTKTVFDEKFKPLGSATDGYTKTEVEALLNNKVDKVSGKQLSTNDFTAAYKTKLDGIATGANKYVHPNDANTRHVTDAEKSTWNNKANANHTHNSLLAINLSEKTVSLNDYTLASGSPNIAYYYCTSDGGGANITGRPNDNAKNAFYLRVELIRWINEADYVSMQTYVKHDEKVMYVRYCKTGVWTAWEKMYTSVQKPSLAELGAAAASHGNHVPTVQTADARKFLRNDNTWQSLPAATTGATGIVQLNDATNSASTTQAATANAVKKAYDLANSKASSSHGHNNLSTRGAVAMESGTTRPAVSGLSMQEAYNDSYPTTYGNVISMRGTGDSQILVGWSGTSGGHAPAYIRSRRDKADAPWSGWAQIYTTAHKPSLTDLGITTLTRGSYLTGSNYNGTAATTWAVDATTTATASKVVARDSNADISCRLVRSNYANQATISGAMAFRVSNSGDDYIRFCSDTGAIRTFLNTYAKSETYTRNEMNSRYRQKTDMVFTDTISITTPAA